MTAPNLEAIADHYAAILKQLGVDLEAEGTKETPMARGVRDTHSVMKVNVMHGAFQKDQTLRSELLSRLSGAR